MMSWYPVVRNICCFHPEDYGWKCFTHFLQWGASTTYVFYKHYRNRVTIFKVYIYIFFFIYIYIYIYIFLWMFFFSKHPGCPKLTLNDDTTQNPSEVFSSFHQRSHRGCQIPVAARCGKVMPWWTTNMDRASVSWFSSRCQEITATFLEPKMAHTNSKDVFFQKKNDMLGI